MNSTWERPKMDIPKTKSEWLWDIIGYAFFIGSILLLVMVWNTLPEEVPAHYNAKGEVDRWGSKWELIFLPAISFFLLLFMSFIERHPEWHNYPARFNESNAKAFYILSRKMLNVEKNICLIVFSVLLIESISVPLGWSNGLGIWMLPMIVVPVLLPLIIMVPQQRKIK